MKTFRKLLFTAFLALSVSFVSQAQEIAHINAQELVAQMPEYKSANDQLLKMRESFAKDYQQMVEEFQTKQLNSSRKNKLPATLSIKPVCRNYRIYKTEYNN